MQAFDLPRVAVIALAKKEEEVFVPGRAEPIVLARDSPGCSCSSGSATRRTASRSASTGSGATRRRGARSSTTLSGNRTGTSARALLRHFGSAERLLEATQEELEGVPGVPAKTARAVYAQLHKAGRA
jgi:excinuclease ABC subunit C